MNVSSVSVSHVICMWVYRCVYECVICVGLCSKPARFGTLTAGPGSPVSPGLPWKPCGPWNGINDSVRLGVANGGCLHLLISVSSMGSLLLFSNKLGIWNDYMNMNKCGFTYRCSRGTGRTTGTHWTL